MAVCDNPGCKSDARPREIPAGDRLITVGVSVSWGKDDIRNAWHGDCTFHSFGCASDYFAEKAADHDGHVLMEGEA